MNEKKIIAVVGATGAQGGGLARAVLRDEGSEFAVRAVTRKPDAGPARALRAAGAEIAAADVDDPASLHRAFEGAYAAFCVTNFWEHLSPERELEQAANMARAARRAGVEHVIWSTLEDTRPLASPDDPRVPTLLGKYKVPHTDAKGEADRHFRDAGVPTTFLLTSFYWENFLAFGGPRRGPDGELVLALPIGQRELAGIAVEDIGKCAYGVFQRGRALVGETIGVASERLTGAAMAAAFSRALREDVTFAPLPVEVFRAAKNPQWEELERRYGFPVADDTANMFELLATHEGFFRERRDPRFARELNPAMLTFDQWLARAGAALTVRS